MKPNPTGVKAPRTLCRLARPWPRGLLAALVLLLGACSDDNPAFFSLEDDIAMGREVKNQVEADTSDFTVLDSASNPEPYQYLYSIQDKILASDDVRYTEEFVWRTRIIVDDETLNAFAAPGGFIYVYTGLIKFLEREDELAGVLAHEIAHADRRHSAQQIQKQYGLNVVLSALTGGDPGLLAQVTGSLLSLTFSRSDESEADEYSVRYLCDTEYASDGAAGFFEKIQDQGGASPPEFLSTHPNPSNRVEDITGLAQELECNLDNATEVSYQDFKQMLP